MMAPEPVAGVSPSEEAQGTAKGGRDQASRGRSSPWVTRMPHPPGRGEGGKSGSRRVVFRAGPPS